jgi:Fic family protein
MPQSNQRLGSYAVSTWGGEAVRAFIPPPLPPTPPILLQDFARLLESAEQALGRLDGVATVLPDPQLFVYTYVRKEAVLSSQIEGTQSSLSDLLNFETEEGVDPNPDVGEVVNYTLAMDHGLQRIRDGFPLSLRLLREIHNILLASGRGSDKTPGEFRTTQNWIGGSRPGNAAFVPPPAAQAMECMGQLELFLHSEADTMPILIKAALAHVQFESIHPFLDGNGRLGRLLITFLLAAEGVLQHPILYLSLYFKTHRQIYYDLLTTVRTEGDWESWVKFFLEAVRVTANQGVDTARRLLRLLDADRQKVTALGSASATTVHSCLQQRPIVSIPQVERLTGLSGPTVAKALKRLEMLGIVSESTGRQRWRRYSYRNYLQILAEGTEPIPARRA